MKNFLFLLAAQILIPFLLKAQFTGDPAQPLVVCNETSIQNNVRSLTDSSGGYYTFWLDKRNGFAGTAVYGQHLDGNGDALWPSNGKEIYLADSTDIAAYRCEAWQSGFLLVWIQRGFTQFIDTMFAQYIDADGNQIWTSPKIIALAGGSIIGFDGAGFNVFPNQLGATISYGVVFSGGAEYFSFNRIDFSGNLFWPLNNFAINFAPYYNFITCSDHMNGLYVLIKGNGIGSAIVIQRFDQDGAAVFPTPVDITTNAGAFAGNITLNSDASGALYVAWDTYASNGIVVTKLTPSGNFAWPSQYADVSNVTSGQSSSYAVLNGSNIYVTWNDTRSGASNYFIYLQRLDTSGTVLWNPGGFQLCNLSSYLPVPKLVASDSGSVIATYACGGQFLAQKIAPDSTLKFPVNGEPLSNVTLPFYGDYQLVTGDGGCFAAFWTDDLNNIYGAGLCSNMETGIEEPMKVQAVIFPNPSEGILNVQLQEDWQQADVVITTVEGKMMKQVLSHDMHKPINVSALPDGIYVLKVYHNEKWMAEKFIIQR